MNKMGIASIIVGLILLLSACQNESVQTLNTDQINQLMTQVDANNPAFTQKNVKFDSIVTLAGTRQYRQESQKIKAKIFYFGDLARGYYNLADRDDKNLQIFGKKVDGLWIHTCVTKINMEEVGGYLILDQNRSGIWSSGHINFEKQEISFKKFSQDYTELTSW